MKNASFKFSKPFFALFAALFTISVAAGSSHAGLFDLFGGNKQAAPAQPKEYYIHDDKSFAEQTKPFGMMPYSKAELEFEILIPKDWEVIETPDASSETAQQIISRLAEYRSPMIGTLQAVVHIDALKLQHEISAQNWLKNYMLTSGFSPDGEIVAPDIKNASGYYIRTGDPGAPSTKEYMAAHISGNWVLLATCEAPLPISGHVKYVQKKIVDSFKILYPKDESVEDQKIFTLVDSIKFGYPASWEVIATDFKDMNRLSVHIQNKGQSRTVDGFIRIVAVRRARSNDLLTEVVEQRKYFEEVMKLKVLKMISTGKAPVYDRFLFNRYEVYDVAPIKNKAALQEVHMAIICDKEWYIFIYLFTAKESTNLYQWGRNVQSLQEILKSTK